MQSQGCSPNMKLGPKEVLLIIDSLRYIICRIYLISPTSQFFSLMCARVKTLSSLVF